MEPEQLELVKMSTKGQLVVPREIRAKSRLSPGQRFIAFPMQDGVFFKKVEITNTELNFKALARDIEAQFNKKGVQKRDVTEAVRWARKS